MSLLDINFEEPKLKDFKCFRLPIDNLPNYKEVLIFGNVYNFFGTFIDDDFGFTQTAFSGEGSADNFMNFGQFVLNGGHATIIASKETCNYNRRLYKEFYKAGFGTTHPKVTFFEIDDIKFLTGKFKVKEGKEEKIVKGEYFWSQNKKKEWEFNYSSFLETIFEYKGKKMAVIANPPYGKSQELVKKISKDILSKNEGEFVCLGPDNMFKDDFLRSKLESDFDFADPKILFNLDTGGRLIIAKLNKELDDEKNIEDIFLDKKAATLLKAIAEYNSKAEHTFWNIDGTSFARKWNYELKDCNKKEQFPEEIKHKKFCECVEEQNLFFKSLFWPCGSPKGLVDSYEGQYNIQGKWLDVFNKKRAGDVLVFKTKKERDNFYKWTTQHYGPNYTWIDVPYDKYLCGYIRKAIRDLIGQGAGAGFFTKYLPQVDWSKEWTDEQIVDRLKEEAELPDDWSL